MEYPKELLPQYNYKIIETNDLESGHSVIRKSLKAKAEFLDDLNDVRIDAICEKASGVFGLSINIFSIFICEHIKIEVSNKIFHEDWNPGEEIPINRRD